MKIKKRKADEEKEKNELAYKQRAKKKMSRNNTTAISRKSGGEGSILSAGLSGLGKITSFGQKMSKKKCNKHTHEGMSDK